jgi:ribosomal protein S6
LFILNTAGREEGIKEAIDKISAEITSLGGKVETVQKMDRRPFARVTNKHIPAGFYVNVIFEGNPQTIAQLRAHFAMWDEIYRVMFSKAPPVTPEAES